jgi:sodium pump decarboxylase gamma subunit
MQELGFGLGITAVGMGVIFGLLALLWAVLVLIGRIDVALVRREQAAADEDEGQAGEGAPPAAVQVEGGEDLPAEALAAIAIAVAAHRAQRRREASPTQREVKPGSLIFASRWLAAGRTRQTRSFGRR